MAQIHYKKLMIQRWINAVHKVREIRQELINSSDTADFVNSYKFLNKNLRKSLDVL